MTTPRDNEPAETPGIHFIPRRFAKIDGKNAVKEAIVLRWLAYKVRHSRNLEDGKRWYYGTIEEIADNYAYIARSTMGEILKRMAAKGMIECGNYNELPIDRTVWYTVPEQYRNADRVQALALDVHVAETLGIPEAVLICNLRHCLDKFKVSSHRMSPSDLARRLPFDRKTISQALKHMMDAGVIVRDPEKPGHYRIPEPRLSEPGEPRKACAAGDTETHPVRGGQTNAGEKPDMLGEKPDMAGEEPDDIGEKPDDNTPYKPLGNTIGKLPLKKKQQAFPTPRRNPSEVHDPDASHPGIRASGLDTGVEGEKPGTGRINANAGVSSTSSDPASDQGKARSWESMTLKDLRASNTVWVNSLSPEEAERQRDKASDVCRIICWNLPRATVEELEEETGSAEEILEELQRFVTSSIPSNPEFEKLATPQAELSIRIALEALTILFYRRDIALPPMAPPEWIGHVLTQAEFWYSQGLGGPRLEDQPRSKDADKEDIPDLKPQMKVRVLLSAIDAMNRRAWHEGEFKRTFYHDAEGGRRALRLFKLNPSLTVSYLLQPIERCANYDRGSRFEDETAFYVRRARNLGFFVKHLRKILEQLEEHCSFPTDELRDLQLEENDEVEGENDQQP